MKPFCIVLVIALICKLQKSSGSEYDYDEGDEAKYFDLRGTLRQDFGLEAISMDPHRSSICSPISALLPIGKLALGAEGKTLNELNKAIGVESDLDYDFDTPSDQLSSHFKGVLKTLEKLPGVILDIANKLYVSNRYRLRSKFSKLAKKIFETSVEETDFDDTKRVLHSINGWVASQTHGMIPSILSSDDISQNSSLVIVNAIYFAGKWKYPFQWVKSGTFHSSKGTRQVPMMSRSQDYEYTFSMPLMAHIVRIPYHGDKSSFLLVLPKERKDLDSVLERLNTEPNMLPWALSKMEMTRIKLTMPKFKIESEWNLRDLYRKVGVSTIFKKKKSELNNIVKDETLIVSAAIQKGVIDVNEFGTEAAASSAIIGFTSSKVDVDVEIYADHPLLFYIMANTQQLFVGAFF